MQNKRAIKRTEDNPGGLISIEVSFHPLSSSSSVSSFSTLHLARHTFCIHKILALMGCMSLQSPLHYSNVMLADPVTGRPVRAAWRYLEDGTKVVLKLSYKSKHYAMLFVLFKLGCTMQCL